MAASVPTADVKLQAPPVELERIPLVQNNRSFGYISDQVSAITEGKATLWWWIAPVVGLS